MLSSSVENLSVRQYNSSIVVGGSKDKQQGGQPKTSSEVLQDRIHTVNINLLDCFFEPACEVPDGFVFPFEGSLEGANIPFLLD